MNDKEHAQAVKDAAVAFTSAANAAREAGLIVDIALERTNGVSVYAMTVTVIRPR